MFEIRPIKIIHLAAILLINRNENLYFFLKNIQESFLQSFVKIEPEL